MGDHAFVFDKMCSAAHLKRPGAHEFAIFTGLMPQVCETVCHAWSHDSIFLTADVIEQGPRVTDTRGGVCRVAMSTGLWPSSCMTVCTTTQSHTTKSFASVKK